MISDKIEGVPEGYEVVRFGNVNDGEWYLAGNGDLVQHLAVIPTQARRLVIRRVSPPVSKYRPFANAAEFEPHRDRWWRYKDEHTTVSRPPANYSDSGHHGYDYEYGLERKVFDDGSPFGVEVTE